MNETHDELIGIHQNIYVKDLENVWISGKIVSIHGKQITVQLEDDTKSLRVYTVENFKSETYPKADNYDLLCVEDLCQLPYLNEPSILDVLRKRYQMGIIYTSIKHILISINPYSWKTKDDLYSHEMMQKYKQMEEIYPPHLFEISSQAFRSFGLTKTHQVVIVGGESGAGKTECVKLLLNHIAEIGQTQNVALVERILCANLILEYLGNAKTIRNNNSSRYGKFLTLFFDDSSKFCGARILTYLLEKRRVSTRSNLEEMSFHILYLAHSTNPILSKKEISEFKYLECMSDSLGSILPLNEDFSNALRNGMGLKNIEIEQVFTFLSGIILIGQLSDSEEIESECLANCCKMLHIDSIELRKYLENKVMNIGDEKISIKRTADQNQKFRGSLASDLYSVLFHWVVDRINNMLFSEKDAANLSPGISLIDIFGFETLQENCFEQLLINYANEKLHYFFISVSVIKEQELYKEEGIPLTDFDFSRLFDVLSAIEGPAGIIDLLHDQISLNQPDTYLIHKIRQAQNRKDKPNPMQIVQVDKFQPLFKICHYAGDVRYSIEGITERNNDIPVGYLKELKGICQHPILTQYVESVEKKQSTTDKNYKQARSSVARNFRQELTHMIEVIENAGIHFIKCINPNSSKAPLLFHPKAVSNQLLFNGISEVAAVVRSKYMCYYTVAEFFQKFGALLPLAFDRTRTLPALQFLLSEEAHYAVGKTKVFLSEKGYYMLENRLMLLIRSVILIQTRIRGYQHQKCYKARLSRALQGRKIIITSIKRFIFRKRVALQVLRNKCIIFLKRRALLAWCNILIRKPLLPVNIDTSKESLVTSCDVLTSTSTSILRHSCHELDVEDIYDILELIIFIGLGLIVYISSLYFIPSFQI